MINEDGNSQESEIEQTVTHGRNVERELVKAHFKPAAASSASTREWERYEKWQRAVGNCESEMK